jgi:hypothetical protein
MLNHWFVHAYVWSRVGDGVAKLTPCVGGRIQFSVARALFPRVVFVGRFVSGSTSQASGEDGFWSTSAQPGVAVQHQSSRVSVDE